MEGGSCKGDGETSYDDVILGAAALQRRSTNRVALRLVVQQSSVLPKLRRVAVLDGYDEVEVGRDVAISNSTPRIRLKDMEVSKHHATIFWNRESAHWAVVDMGSKHGTFLLRRKDPSDHNSSNAEIDEDGADVLTVRLSENRKASVPQAIRHLDMLKIGTTSFIAHVHPESLPCLDCASDTKFDIPLFSSSSTKSADQSRKRDRDEPAFGQMRSLEVTEREYDPRTTLTRLKKRLLSRHESKSSRESPESSGGTTKYVDRSAKRRNMFTTSSAESPGVYSRSMTPVVTDNPDGNRATSSPSASTPMEDRNSHIPISEDNIGHKLLEKQGWSPGLALGVIDLSRGTEGPSALLEPIQVTANRGKTGIGMSGATSGDVASTSPWPRGDREETFMRKRWDEASQDRT